MKFAIVLFALVVTSISLASERAVIQQMKGRRAIVQFEKDIPFSVGQKIFLNSDDGAEYGIRKETRNFLERKNLISISSFITTIDTKPSTTAYGISGRYGWNQQQYEFGPMASISYYKVGSISASETTKYLFGGFFDFNLIPNKPGEDFIFGGYAEGSVGSSKVGASNKSVTIMTGGGFVKWFIFSPMLAVRANVLYSNEKQDSASRNTTGVEVGINHYF